MDVPAPKPCSQNLLLNPINSEGSHRHNAVHIAAEDEDGQVALEQLLVLGQHARQQVRPVDSPQHGMLEEQGQLFNSPLLQHLRRQCDARVDTMGAVAAVQTGTHAITA